MLKTSAILLAGDRKASKLIEHENKAFLEFRGEPLFIHVLRALLGAESVGPIVIVGPSERLSESIRQAGISESDRALTTVVEQRENLLNNAKAGFLATLPEEAQSLGFDNLRGTPYADRYVLYASCDIPLVTSYEIDEFLGGCDMDRFDYSIGLTAEEVMTHYYPTDTKPGIRMAYFHLKEGRFRHNNLHIGRPLKATQLKYIERMYELRYQTKWYNIFWSALMILSTGRMLFALVRLYTRLQRARTLYGRGRMIRYERVRRRNTLTEVITCIEKVLGFRMQTSFTSFGGATLDVDNADHLAIAEQMADAWIQHQREIHHRLQGEG